MNREIILSTQINIHEHTGLKKEFALNFKKVQNWDGHAFAVAVGMANLDGSLESFFVDDQKNESTLIFENLKSENQLLIKRKSIVRDDKLTAVDYYFVPYFVKDHPSTLKTIDTEYVVGASNVEYDCTFEVQLVADEDYKRYVYIDYKTKGMGSIPLFGMIENLEDTFEEFFKDKKNDFKYEDGAYFIAFYDNTGDKNYVENMSITEFLSMIVSIRMVKLECTIL